METEDEFEAGWSKCASPGKLSSELNPCHPPLSPPSTTPKSNHTESRIASGRHRFVSHLVEPIFVVVPPVVECLEDARQMVGRYTIRARRDG